MTMERSEKAEALANLKPETDGYTKIRFASPKLVRAARIERGHDRMTPAEVATHRLGRGSVSADMAHDAKIRHSRFRKITRQG